MTEREKEGLSPEEFREIYSKVPRLCVDLVITTPQGILMTRRAVEHFKGLWHLPGGGVRKGETVNEAIDRIARTELGLTLEPGAQKDFVGYMEILKEGDRHSVSLVFKIGLDSIKPVLDFQASEWKIFNNMLPAHIQPYHEGFLQKNWGKIFNR